MRWTPSKILSIAGLALIAIAPFVIAFLLLPDDNPDSASSDQAQGSVTIPLEFPFSGVTTTLPPASPAAEPSPDVSPNNRQCGNGRDDDRDGRIDTADPGCSSRTDNSESPDPSPRPTSAPSPSPSPAAPPASPEPPPEQNCNDQGDNDGDGFIDGGDPGCGDGNEGPFNPPLPGGGGDDDGFLTNPTIPNNTTTTTTTQPPASPQAPGPGDE